jgi:CRISPR-associated endonuclease/helicase Cas3
MDYYTDYYAKPNITIAQHAQRLLKELERLKEYHYISDELYPLVRKACLHHDDGKANREFQLRVAGSGKKFNPQREIPHNILSGYMIDPQEFDTEEDYYRVLFAIVFHHDYGSPTEIMKEQKDLITELLKDFPTQKITRRMMSKIQDTLFDPKAIKIKGFLHKCDYSASGDYIAEYPNDFLEDCMENVKQKWQKTNPESDWNDLQKFCMKKRNENIIAVAQTGMGKTEAGLQWIGNHKGYFVLPLRTAINAIYDRVCKDILLEEELDEKVSILHSESLEYYLKQHETEFDLLEYENRGKRFSIPLNISTMDQLFDFIFKYQTYELKLTTLSYSRIVIDEIQMYDPELLRYLIYGLKLITDLGGKVAIMTATLSPFVKELLMREIPFQEENIKTFVNDMIRHHVEIRNKKINAEDIIKFYNENQKLGRSNKILIVCNTIRKAQEIYQELSEQMEDLNVLHILHSRFVKKERAELEKEIIKFGKTYDENGALDCCAGIWISTSLVEASLDIDFDYLFTELQDLNSLFQRFGRCNRKGKKDVTRANCYVYTEIESSILTSNRNGFIDEVIFELSKKAIEEGEGLLTESRKLELLNQYLTMDNLKDSDYYRRYKNAERMIDGIRPYRYQKKENQLRNILSEEVIPSPVYEENAEKITSIVKQFTESNDKVERIKLKEELMQYSVTIPYWQWFSYQKNLKKGMALSFPTIQLGKNQEISVIECIYDELGYRPMKYESAKRPAEIL